jgi:lactate dehydrogenase-like 2-hydroxyacid dehydrogenase
MPRACRFARFSMQTPTSGDDWQLTDAGRRELKDLEGKWSRICVLGGSKGVGKEIVSLLSARGVKVVALVRKDESKAELDALPGVTSVIGDALEASDVIGVLDGDTIHHYFSCVLVGSMISSDSSLAACILCRLHAYSS